MGIAKSEGIDGIVGLCNKAVVPVADLTQRMSLQGNDPESIEKFLSKNDFHTLQEKAVEFFPLHVITETAEEAEEKSRGLHLKVLFVKQDTFFLFTTFIVFFD